MGCHRNLWFFSLFRKRGDPVHLTLNILGQFFQVPASKHFHIHCTDPFTGPRGYLTDPIQSLNRLLNDQNDTLLHLFGTGSRIGNDHIHVVQVKLRKHLLLDMHSPDNPPHKENNHQQIGGHGMACHPGDWPFFILRCQVFFHPCSSSCFQDPACLARAHRASQ